MFTWAVLSITKFEMYQAQNDRLVMFGLYKLYGGSL